MGHGLARRSASARKEPDFDIDVAPAVTIDPAKDRTARPPTPAARTSDPERTPKRGKAKTEKKETAKRRRGSGTRFTWRRALYWGLVFTLWLVIAAIGTLIWVGMHLPPLQSLDIPKRPPSIQILGLDQKPLAIRGEGNSSTVTLKEMPTYLPKAFIAIEDRRFYQHHGVDPFGLLRATVANVLHRGVSQGGSTLTQQLAKNLFLTHERTFSRKLQEVVLALWLEHKFSKDQILELYLNRVYFGAGAYGVEAASQRYYGKSARQTTLAEAAMLAGLVKSPSRLAPTRNFDAAQRRAQTVLAAMAEAGFIKDDAVKLAAARPPGVVKQSAGGSANYVADFVLDALDDLIGHPDDDIVVETSIDPVLQAAAEKALVEELAARGDKFGVEQGALIALSPDGAVRALVGGKNYNESQFDRAVSAKRQPGSAFKPFVYLTALEHGLTPDTLREDKPIALKGWKPENYKHEYFGPVTLRQALANSLNTVSVRLTLEVGPAAVTKTAYRLGIASKLEPNASIALGTSEVSPIELVAAYVPFANGGFAITPHVVERVRAGNRALYVRKDRQLGRVIDPTYVAMMDSMMRETIASGTARRADLPGWLAAGKTGTSQDFRDAWFVGFTGHMVTGVWLGNDDSSPTKKLTGGSLPVDIWSRFMKVAHARVPVVMLPGVGSSGGLFGLPGLNGFDGEGAGAMSGAVARPAASVDPRAQASQRSGLDGWLIDQFFSRH
ncbi:MAG TPA: transglycosylase domain-containing protein [Xanthobacteraceae bacterium]|nr:transglycosylase domain-containing protein [Xanthobacteraceae bacterium]